MIDPPPVSVGVQMVHAISISFAGWTDV